MQKQTKNYHIITGVKLHIDSLFVSLPGVVFGAPVMCNDDLESTDFNDGTFLPGVVLGALVDYYNITTEDNDCDD